MYSSPVLAHGDYRIELSLGWRSVLDLLLVVPLFFVLCPLVVEKLRTLLPRCHGAQIPRFVAGSTRSRPYKVLI